MFDHEDIPSIRPHFPALEDLYQPHEQNPIVLLQFSGLKPLFSKLIHPGIGESLIFLDLSS
jgi:hypothetical protein